MKKTKEQTKQKSRTKTSPTKQKSKEAEYLEGWKRARAELDNIKKRMETERAEHRKRVQQDIAQQLLPIADMFFTISQHVPDDLQDNSWAQGVVHVARQYEQMLDDMGIAQIGKSGDTFDPTRHEAIETKKDTNTKKGHVIHVASAGYVMGDTTLRPAKVIVAS